jgi:hypothetical protein
MFITLVSLCLSCSKKKSFASDILSLLQDEVFFSLKEGGKVGPIFQLIPISYCHSRLLIGSRSQKPPHTRLTPPIDSTVDFHFLLVNAFSNLPVKKKFLGPIEDQREKFDLFRIDF